MTIRVIEPPDYSDDIRELIGSLDVDDMSGAILIGMNKDGTVFLRTTRINSQEKTYMMAFAQSWLNKLFDEALIVRDP